jgi:two-component system, NarL family, sensor kinase
MYAENKELFIVILVGAGILLAVLIYFVLAVMRQQRRVYRWQQERIAAEITTLENERKRIASDLHDELGPVLSAVRLQINHLEPADETEKVILDKSTGQIDEVIKRFREISYDLLPNTLVRKGLDSAIAEFIDKMQGINGLDIVVAGTIGRLPEEKEINIYRIIQEIVHNTIKHARAGKLQISLERNSNQLLLRTKDDGVGFSYEMMDSHNGGLGLLNLQSRADVLNAELIVQTKQGKGTCFEIKITV